MQSCWVVSSLELRTPLQQYLALPYSSHSGSSWHCSCALPANPLLRSQPIPLFLWVCAAIRNPEPSTRLLELEGPSPWTVEPGAARPSNTGISAFEESGSFWLAISTPVDGYVLVFPCSMAMGKLSTVGGKEFSRIGAPNWSVSELTWSIQFEGLSPNRLESSRVGLAIVKEKVGRSKRRWKGCMLNASMRSSF